MGPGGTRSDTGRDQLLKSGLVVAAVATAAFCCTSPAWAGGDPTDEEIVAASEDQPRIGEATLDPRPHGRMRVSFAIRLPAVEQPSELLRARLLVHKSERAGAKILLERARTREPGARARSASACPSEALRPTA